MSSHFIIEEELKKLPDSGVYLMHNAEDEIIYVGKAVSLRNRVRQYFQSGKNKSAKVLRMVSQIDHFEYIVTDSELEALVLESNLIKEHRPKYNTMLKDDKTYPYIKEPSVKHTRGFFLRADEEGQLEILWPVSDRRSRPRYDRSCAQSISNQGLQPPLAGESGKGTPLPLLSYRPVPGALPGLYYTGGVQEECEPGSGFSERQCTDDCRGAEDENGSRLFGDAV
jgi:hypothetical protein